MYGLGYDVSTSSFLTIDEQYFIPRSKKKRIIKKCAKKYRHTIPDPSVYIIGGRMVMHPATLAKLRAAL